MITYVYETIPTSEGEAPKRYEIRQPMGDPPLTHHPQSGEPIRRVITGGLYVGTRRRRAEPEISPAFEGCGCRPEGCLCQGE